MREAGGSPVRVGLHCGLNAVSLAVIWVHMSGMREADEKDEYTYRTSRGVAMPVLEPTNEISKREL